MSKQQDVINNTNQCLDNLNRAFGVMMETLDEQDEALAKTIFKDLAVKCGLKACTIVSWDWANYVVTYYSVNPALLMRTSAKDLPDGNTEVTTEVVHA